jgi:hypothetical protein
MGVGLVRVRDHGAKVVLVSDTLTHDEEICGRVLAAIMANSQPFVLLTVRDITTAMTAALSAAIVVF